jgi:hypothetical protein
VITETGFLDFVRLLTVSESTHNFTIYNSNDLSTNRILLEEKSQSNVECCRFVLTLKIQGQK